MRVKERKWQIILLLKFKIINERPTVKVNQWSIEGGREGGREGENVWLKRQIGNLFTSILQMHMSVGFHMAFVLAQTLALRTATSDGVSRVRPSPQYGSSSLSIRV